MSVRNDGMRYEMRRKLKIKREKTKCYLKEVIFVVIFVISIPIVQCDIYTNCEETICIQPI